MVMKYFLILLFCLGTVPKTSLSLKSMAYSNCDRIIDIPLGIKTLNKSLELKNNPQLIFKKNIRKKLRDDVIVYFLVNELGYVEKAKVLKGQYESINKFLLRAAIKMKFKPFSENGIAIPVQFMKIFHFPIHNKSSSTIKSEIVFSNLRLPNIIHYAKPKYSDIAIKKRLKGEVIVSVTHDIYGKVIKLNILKSKYKDFTIQAKNALKQWIHRPLNISGVPSRLTYIVDIQFESKNNVKCKLFFCLNYNEMVLHLKSLLDHID